MDSIVRLESIDIKNFKNVCSGHLNFENSRKNYTASILGLYGQNGSGKTALIDVLSLLKILLSGNAVPADFADCINVDAQSSAVEYEFKIEDRKGKNCYKVFYSVSFRRDKAEPKQTPNPIASGVDYKVTVFNELLSFSYKNSEGKYTKKTPLINTKGSDKTAFTPTGKYFELVGKDKKNATDMIVAKKMAEAASRSFIFSKELSAKTEQNCKDERYRFLLARLAEFGNSELFVINTRNSGLISMNLQTLSFKYVEKNGGYAMGNVVFDLNSAAVIPEDALNTVKKVIDSMNIVLRQLVPGLTIAVRDIGREISANNIVSCTIQLVSEKNGKEIPLKYESEGIQKIISVLQLLIVVYNNDSVTVAIDELDSGIFEYLLGELLLIISEKGKGQLIFTSHNLRPLETMDKGFIAFTTTNPQKRYIRMSNIKTSNNLRDFYYRDIVLGLQSEPIYEATNNSEIALALREAGTVHDA